MGTGPRILLAVLLAAAGLTAQDSVVRIAAEGEAAKYWPWWRGPSGQGLVSGSAYPDKWSDKDNVLWKVSVAGEGNSSPIVWGDRIFLTTAYNYGTRRSLLCFRRTDGKLLWETFAPDARPEYSRQKNGHASGTPATDGHYVYAYFGNHGLIAVDFNGRLAWHRSIGVTSNYHGTACSPLLYKDRVVIYQDQGYPNKSFVAAFDKLTGDVRWWTDRSEQVGWGSPIAIHTPQRDEIIVSSQYQVYSYNPDTGKVLWTARGNTDETVPTPVVGNGLIYCSSGRAGPTLAIKPGGEVVWESPRGSPFIPSTLLYGDHLYLVNDMTSIATCLDAKTGRSLWQGRLGYSMREGFTASPVAIDGKLFFTNDLGETYVLKAGAEFNLLHVNNIGESTLASPALVDGHWYIRTERHLFDIGASRN